MSAAEPMDLARRERLYLAQTGRADLTPAQRRRVRHKENESERPHARVGRLRRRYDRQDSRKVQAHSRRMTALIREYVTLGRFAPKPSSKRQKALRRRRT